jgi:hypothetical protein
VADKLSCAKLELGLAMNELSYRRVELKSELSKFDELYFCPSRAVIGNGTYVTHGAWFNHRSC